MKPEVINALKRALATMVAAVTLLAGCSSSDIPGVYRIDIQQGNVVTQDMLARLEPGMSRRQVRFILGTPLLVDTFNESRWDYIYTFKTGTGRAEQRAISVHFDNERLARLEGDIAASANLQPPEPRRQDKVVKVDNTRESGLLQTLNPFDDSPEQGTLPDDENAESASPDASDDATDDASAASDRAVEATEESSAAIGADSEQLADETATDGTQSNTFDEDPAPPPSIWQRFKSTVGLESDGESPASNAETELAQPVVAPDPDPEPVPEADTDNTETVVGDRATPESTDESGGGVWDRLRATFADDDANASPDAADTDSNAAANGPSEVDATGSKDSATADSDSPTETAGSEGGAIVEERDTAADADGGFFSRLRKRISFPGGLFGSEATAKEPPATVPADSEPAPVEEAASPVPTTGQ